MFGTKPGEHYHAAVKRLQKAEEKHRQALGRLADSLASRSPDKVTAERRECEQTERTLQEVLQEAFAAHRAYWAQRRDKIADQLEEVARVLAEYNALARLAGDLSVNPALQRLQQFALSGVTANNLLTQESLIDEAGVPQEPPDSALLEDEFGSWRGANR
ncbi:hypothetical protein C8261_08725 [Pseudothauera lacus]|uniref:Uncharacterized protein n=2 Tax=Pseudothauera lacus TaxID=2136175 RepID=A0A2T4IF44_9RHOO|nr:hypothetical protein C8261_08725 [Pseudothauera lacus]